MLMKKISLLLVGVLALFSCEQEELDNFVESSGVGQVMTRAIGSSADFDPISACRNSSEYFEYWKL